MQETINNLGKRIAELKYSEAISSKMDNEKEKDKDKERERLPPAQIIKKSRIGARRTLDNTSLQRSYDQIKEVAESK